MFSNPVPDVPVAVAARLDSTKTMLSLPAPLGSELYLVTTNCGNFCSFQKELFDRCFPVAGRHCDRNMPCHTVEWNICKIHFTLSNIKTVLEDYGEWIFPTMEEACAKRRKILTNHRKAMRMLGFEMREDGSCVDRTLDT